MRTESESRVVESRLSFELPPSLAVKIRTNVCPRYISKYSMVMRLLHLMSSNSRKTWCGTGQLCQYPTTQKTFSVQDLSVCIFLSKKDLETVNETHPSPLGLGKKSKQLLEREHLFLGGIVPCPPFSDNYTPVS